MRPLVALSLAVGVLTLAACGDDGGSAGSAGGGSQPPSAPPADDYGGAAYVTCDDYLSWREAQDDLEANPEYQDSLDDDNDDVACNDLGQGEYEEAFTAATAEACEAVFLESPDGVLYLDGYGYEQGDCDSAAPLADEWDGDTYVEPADAGAAEGWAQTCEEFFDYTVGGDLYWGDQEVIVGTTDCELLSPY